jgi:hypothetical protein
MVIAALAVLAAAGFAYRGRLGAMSAERADYVPLDLGPVSATDVALLRPPTSLWGYNMEATDEAMEQIAESIRERDVRIVALEQLVTDLGRDHAPVEPLGSPYVGARRRPAPADGIADTETTRWEQPGTAWQAPEQSWDGQEPSLQEQEPTWQEQPWQDHEVAWELDQVQPGEVQHGREQAWQEQEQPWQQEQEEPEPPWQAPEPRSGGDNQAPPPEQSHD